MKVNSFKMKFYGTIRVAHWMIIFMVSLMIQECLSKPETYGTHPPRRLRVRHGDYSRVLVSWLSPDLGLPSNTGQLSRDTDAQRSYVVTIKSVRMTPQVTIGPDYVRDPPCDRCRRKKLCWCWFSADLTKGKYKVTVEARSKNGKTLGKTWATYRHSGPPSGISIRAEAVNATTAKVTLTSLGHVEVKGWNVFYSDDELIKWKKVKGTRLKKVIQSSVKMANEQVVTLSNLTGKRYYFMAKAKVNNKMTETMTHLVMRGPTVVTTTTETPAQQDDASTAGNSSSNGRSSSTGDRRPPRTAKPTPTPQRPLPTTQDMRIKPDDKLELELELLQRHNQGATFYWKVVKGSIEKINNFKVRAADINNKTLYTETIGKKHRFFTLENLEINTRNTNYTFTLQAFDETQLLAKYDMKVVSKTQKEDDDLRLLLAVIEVRAEKATIIWALLNGKGITIDKYTVSLNNITYAWDESFNNNDYSYTINYGDLTPEMSYYLTVKAIGSGRVILEATLNFTTPPTGVYGKAVTVTKTLQAHTGT